MAVREMLLVIFTIVFSSILIYGIERLFSIFVKSRDKRDWKEDKH